MKTFIEKLQNMSSTLSVIAKFKQKLESHIFLIKSKRTRLQQFINDSTAFSLDLHNSHNSLIIIEKVLFFLNKKL